MTWETGWTPRAIAPNRQAALGVALVALGVAVIVWGVFHLLAALPRPDRLDFAHRTTDHQNRSVAHERFAGTLWRGLAGLAIAAIGARLRARALRGGGRPTA
jgi:hypothetical protein